MLIRDPWWKKFGNEIWDGRNSSPGHLLDEHDWLCRRRRRGGRRRWTRRWRGGGAPPTSRRRFTRFPGPPPSAQPWFPGLPKPSPPPSAQLFNHSTLLSLRGPTVPSRPEAVTWSADFVLGVLARWPVPALRGTDCKTSGIERNIGSKIWVEIVTKIFLYSV